MQSNSELMKDLKKENGFATAVANKISELGVSSDKLANSVSLAEGDKFKIVNVDKYENNDNSNANRDFANILFVLDNGARVGARNFNKVSKDLIKKVPEANYPELGRTVGEVVTWACHMIAEEILFKCTEYSEEEREYQGNKYKRKNYGIKAILD